MRVGTILTGLAIVLLLSSPVMSQVYLAKESFDYPLGATIDTLMGGAANGWGGSWYKIAAPQAKAAVAADTGLVYDDLSYSVSHAGNHLETVPDPTGTEQRYGRHLDKTWPNEAGRTYWISFIMNVKNATDNATWLGVKYYNGDAGELAMLGKGHGLDKYTVGSGWHGGEGPEVSAITWGEGPVWLVGKTVMQGATSSTADTTYMWISPDPAGGEPSIATANAVAITNMKNGFNTIRIEFGGSVGDGLQASFDELRLGTSWGDVSTEMYLARESFEYSAGTSIDTLMGSASNGWGGSWYKLAAPQAKAAVAADTGLVYDDLSYPVLNVGRHLETVPDPTGTEQRYGRHLDKTWPNEAGRTYWMSFIMSVRNATDNATWLGVKYYLGDTGELGMLGKGHGLDKYTVGSGWHGGEGPEVSAITWGEGPVWLVGKTVMQGATSSTADTTYMWISPDPAGGEPSIATANAVAITNMKNGFNTIRIEFGGSVGDGLQASFDELRLGTSWGDVSSPLFATAVTRRRTELPTQFVLSQNYPNPFNPSTTISYTLKKNGKVRLTIYNIIGREVAVLVDGVQSAGKHDILFSGAGLPSGVYFYRLQTGNETIAMKMALVK